MNDLASHRPLVHHRHDSVNQPFEIKKRIKSFEYAFNGIWTLLQSQHNAWIHAVATVLVILIGFTLCITVQDWCWIVLAIISVWTAEAFNTSLEFLSDATTKEIHPLICKAKDVAAGAVLITAAGSVVIGILILGPHVYKFLKG
jgi:diacylglycerol kinase (ATP)